MGVLIYGVYKFTGEDVVINSRQEEPFPEVLVRISLTAVSFSKPMRNCCIPLYG